MFRLFFMPSGLPSRRPKCPLGKRIGWIAATLGVLGLVLPGCRLPFQEGPVPKALAASRELSRLGMTAIEAGKWDRAEELLAKAVKTCPEDCDARRHYAEALWHQGRREKAVAELQRAAETVGADATLHVRLAEMQLAMGRADEAAARVEMALDRDPKLAAAWAVRGRIFAATGRTQPALADYHRALGYAPGDRQLLWETAELYRHAGQPQKALAMLHSLLDTYSPGEEPQGVIRAEGLTLAALGRHAEAAQRFGEALARGQPTAELHYLLAEAQPRVGRPAEAAASARAALALAPDHAPSRVLLERLATVPPPRLR